MNQIAIIGAGFSSAVLSHYLRNDDIIIFEKARGPGGRSSTRKVEGVGVFDHGLQYITPKSKGFLEFIKNLSLVKKWNGTFVELGNAISVIPSTDKYIGINGNNDFVKSILNLDQCKLNHKIINIKFKSDHWQLTTDKDHQFQSKKLILTMPQEQTNDLIRGTGIDFEIKDHTMKPCFTMMLALQGEHCQHAGYIIKNSSILSWCANESSKQRELNNKNLTLVTVQSSEAYAFQNYKRYRADKALILDEMLHEFLRLFQIDNNQITHKDVHGWLYAFSENESGSVYWDKDKQIGITGDWISGGRAEDSWKNAKYLTEIMK
jgi:renalase